MDTEQNRRDNEKLSFSESDIFVRSGTANRFSRIRDYEEIEYEEERAFNRWPAFYEDEED